MKKRSSTKFSILALLFLLITAPLAIYSITNLSSFDTRNHAADLTLDTETCQIKFLYVNPSSIELNKTVQAVVSANTPGEAITQVTVLDRSGNYIVKKDYTNGSDKLSENFTITPKEEGDLGILGTLTTDKGTRPCVVESNRQVTAVASNQAPAFQTQPTSAKPSNAIKVNDSYEYQLQATDDESDNINFAFSFTPDANWLKPTVIENGSSGKLTIKFTGTPDKPGSYLANIFIHDGYNAHLRAQTWVISVDQDKNDIPKVTVIKPASDISVSTGDNVTVSWEAADLNQITKYELYMATNPGNANTWITVNKNISPKVGNYIVDTKGIPDGTYQFIVRATDNFNPPATGMGVSSKVTIGSSDSNNGGTDDGVVLQEAQVVNISPSDQSSIKNKSAIISATLVPSKDATIKKDSIKILFDDQDITSKTRVTQGADNTYVLAYTPEKEHSEGVHKVEVSFVDSKGNKADKSWTFTVIPADTQNNDVFNIFGFQVPKRIVWIVLAGLAILLLALIVPWLLYLAWRGTKDEEYQIEYDSTKPIPPDNTPVTFVKNTTINETEKKKEVEIQPTKENEVKETSQEKSTVNFPSFSFNKLKEEVAKEEEKQAMETKPQVQTVEPMTSPTIEQQVPEQTPQEQTQTNSIMPEQNIPQTPPVQNVTPVVINEPEPMTPPTISPEPVVEQANTDDIDGDETVEDIISNTNKELEELANKLKQKEEMLSEFIPSASNTAPSSSTEPEPENVNAANPADNQ